MSELISGKEALIAIANGQQVEGNIGDGWHEISTTSTVILNSFIFEKNRNGQPVKFRLKPRTITLNGIEVPAPFEPKEGEKVWVLSDICGNGYYTLKHERDFCYRLGAWRTEGEIKQVVVALRSVFKGETK